MRKLLIVVVGGVVFVLSASGRKVQVEAAPSKTNALLQLRAPSSSSSSIRESWNNNNSDGGEFGHAEADAAGADEAAEAEKEETHKQETANHLNPIPLCQPAALGWRRFSIDMNSRLPGVGLLRGSRLASRGSMLERCCLASPRREASRRSLARGPPLAIARLDSSVFEERTSMIAVDMDLASGRDARRRRQVPRAQSGGGGRSSPH